jgi:hypothetical protein
MPQNKPGIFLLSVPSSAPLSFQRLLLDRWCSMKCQEEFASEYFTHLCISHKTQMNFAVAKCALGSTHWLEVKKIHNCQCLRAGFPALAMEWDGVGELVEFSLFLLSD